MRPLRLELRGFTAFRETAILDFEDRRLFAITGPTGSGKSSLLDAMTWALYGQVPRVGRETRQLITQGAESMAVLLDFSFRGDRYRVSRKTPSTAGTRLEQLGANGEWRLLADRASQVSELVTSLLGLDFQTFTKTVLLPQGEFDTFLQGDVRQRREILTGLLGLNRYEKVGRAARNRKAGASGAAKAIRVELARAHEASPEPVSELKKNKKILSKQVEALARQGELLSALAAEARNCGECEADVKRATGSTQEGTRSLEVAQQELDKAKSKAIDSKSVCDRLTTKLSALGYDEEEHRRLERTAAALEQRVTARSALQKAEIKLRAAEKTARTKREQAKTKKAEAERAGEEMAGAGTEQKTSRDTLEAIVAVALSTERVQNEAAENAVREHESAIAAADKREKERQTLAAYKEQLEVQQGALVTAEQECLDASESRLFSETKSDTASKSLQAAESKEVAAEEKLEAARLQDAASTLQRSLNPGDPCPVCGEPITQVEILPAPSLDGARDELEKARQTLSRARKNDADAAQELAAIIERLTQMESAVVRAQEELDAIRARIVEASADPDVLGEKIVSTGNAARAERVRAKSAAEAAEMSENAVSELKLLRARIGEEFSLQPGNSGEPDVVIEGLNQAITNYRDAGETFGRLQEASRLTEEAARAAQAEAEKAVQHYLDVSSACDREREHLASLGGAEQEDAEEIQMALHKANSLASQHRDWGTELQKAKQLHASANAREEAAQATQLSASEAAVRLSSKEALAREALEAASGRLAKQWVAAEISGSVDPEHVPQLVRDHEASYLACKVELGKADQRLKTAVQEAQRVDEMSEDVTNYDESARLAGDLEQELHRNRFIAYVQREAMQLLANDAAERLSQLSDGRYRLTVNKDEFWVIDRFNGDERRSVKTLSGGETFLASLALALALSDRLPEISGQGGAMSLESLFLDEGFGSLDQESLDVAIGGLEALSGGRRLVGVISHIPEIAERLSDHVEVVKSGATSSIRDVRSRGPEAVI